MNFYKHFIGDYQRDTMHLTMMQDGSYRRLLDACYATERVLPADTDACYRLARAFSKDEREATDAVLREFFPVGLDGSRHNKRTEKELANATAYADAQSMRAHKRWQMQADMQTHDQGQCPGDASHSHSHSHSTKPDTKAKKAKATPASRALPDWLPTEPWQAFVEMRKKIRAPLTDRGLELSIRKLHKLQSSGEDVTAVLDQSVERSWRGLFPVKPNGSDGNGGAPWWSSNEGIQAKAAELGVSSRTGETWNDLKARVNVALEKK